MCPRGEDDPRVYRRRRRVLRTLRSPDGRPILGPDGKPTRCLATDEAGRPVYARSRKWYYDFRDASGRLRTRAGCKSKRATVQMALDAQKAADYERAGVRSHAWTEGTRRLDEHLTAFERHLKAKGDTTAHVKTTLGRLRRMQAALGWQHMMDMETDGILAWLDERRRAPATNWSAETANHYLRAVRAFGRWLVRTGRAVADPAAGCKLLKTEADRRCRRRALSEDECRLLLEKTERGPVRMGVSGPERALLYRLALGTGLRANELRHLVPERFDLENVPPAVTVLANYSKRRREDVLPLRRDLASRLQAWIDERGESGVPIIRVPERTAEMLRADLEAAGIPIEDGSGRRADFHALRVTFGTHLARCGVVPKVAQDLLRHSDIRLTMDVYTLTLLGDRASAVERLPSLERHPRRSEGKAAAG